MIFVINHGLTSVFFKLRTRDYGLINQIQADDNKVEFTFETINGNFFSTEHSIKILSFINDFSNQIDLKQKDEKLKFLLNKLCKITESSLGNVYTTNSDTNEVLRPTNIWYTENHLESSSFKERTQNYFIKSGLDIPGKSFKKIGIEWSNNLKYSNYYHRFNTYSADKQIKGTGLGLNIAYQIAKTMEGSLACQSKLGVGSTFTLNLNLEKAEPVKVEDKKTKKIPEKSLKVLVVEVNKINQKVAGLILDQFCKQIDFADNGQDMFDKYEDDLFGYDIVFKDINMPIMDGMQTTNKMIMDLELCPPIIGLSANAMEGDKEKHLALVMYDYISKPVTKNKMIEVIQSYV